MSAIVADTHALIWYLLDAAHLSSASREAMDRATADGESIFVASISLVEVAYGVEKGKLPTTVYETIDDVVSAPDTTFVLAPLDLGVARALRQVPRGIVPDMPDRIIAATALHLRMPLVTRDARIRAAGLETIW